MSKGSALLDSCIFMFDSIHITLTIQSGINYSKTVRQMCHLIDLFWKYTEVLPIVETLLDAMERCALKI